jgi:hypothetical protein
VNGLQLYRTDAQARSAAGAAGLDVSAWPVADLTQLDTWRQTAFASIYFTFPGVSRATLTKALGCMPAPCSALTEGMGASRSFGAYGATDNRDLLKELAAARGCDSDVMDRLGAAQELGSGEAVGMLDLINSMTGQIPTLLAPHQ